MSLGKVIHSQRKQMEAQAREIGTLREMLEGEIGGRGRGDMGGAPWTRGLQSSDREALTRDVLDAVGRDYLPKTLFPGVRVPTDLSAYVTHEQLGAKNYVNHPEMEGRDYVDQRELTRRDYVDRSALNHAIPAPVLLPPRLDSRLAQLEKDVQSPGGTLDKLAAGLRDLGDKKRGATVSAGPYSFKDAASADGWIKTVNVADALQFCPDFRMQLALMGDATVSEADQLRAMADAGKAGYKTIDVARLHLSYKNPFPETMLKLSTLPSAARTGGRVFTNSFYSAKVYEGDSAASPKKEFLRHLEQNRRMFQQGINLTFPPDQQGTSKINAVFAYVLHQGYLQATSFLESLEPFFKLMTGSGLTDDEGWEKVLMLVVAVFQRVHQVRTVTNVAMDGAYLYGMLKASALLDEFTQLDWVRHPDVSSGLVLAALQKDAKAVEEALELLRKNVNVINANKNKVNAVEKELERLKKLNKSWQT